MTLAFMSFGFAELLLVGIVALLVFGGNLPDVMRTLGRSYAKFRQSLHEFSRPVREEMRQVTTLPPDVPPVSSSDSAAVPEYPDYHDEVPEADLDPELDTEAGPPPPARRDEPEIDEPPPV